MNFFTILTIASIFITMILSLFFFINTIMFVLLLNPDVYYIIAKYKNNNLRETDKLEYLQKLNSWMETEKPYLNPDISLEILYQVGFNSKSAFNNQFKLFTNLTPIEYRSKAIG